MVGMELYFFAAFLTDYAQFPLKTAGQIMLLTSLFDVACAIGGAVILQRVTLHFGGKYRSWFLVGPPIVAPLFVLQFVKIGSDSIAALVIIFAFLSSHMLWNVVYAAVGSMLGRLSKLPDERTTLSASRVQGGCAAGLIFSMATVPIMTFFSAHTNRMAGFAITVGIYTFLMICGYLYIYRITAGKDPYDESVGVISREPLSDLIGLVLKNRPLLLLITADTFNNTCSFVVLAFAFYYFTYVVRNIALLPIFMLATSISALLGSLAAVWIGVKLGKRKSYWISLSMAALTYASAALVAGTTWRFTFIFCVALMFQEVALSMSTALFSDTVIYGEWKTGRSIRAFTMGLQNLTAKLGIFLRSAVVTLGLMAMGFVANQVPTPGIVRGISSIMAFAPAAACATAAALLFFGYRIEEKNVIQMQDEIAAKQVHEVANI